MGVFWGLSSFFGVSFLGFGDFWGLFFGIWWFLGSLFWDLVVFGVSFLGFGDFLGGEGGIRWISRLSFGLRGFFGGSLLWDSVLSGFPPLGFESFLGSLFWDWGILGALFWPLSLF